MEGDDSSSLIAQLSERAKELTCLYEIEGLLKEYGRPIDEVLREAVAQLPPAWEYPSICTARITLGEAQYETADFAPSPLMLSEPIVVKGSEVGRVEVAYRVGNAGSQHSFLPEEEQLLRTIADRIGDSLEYRELREVVQEIEELRLEERRGTGDRDRWRTVVELLLRTDQKLYARVARKLLTYMSWNGVPGAARLMSSHLAEGEDPEEQGTQNVPQNVGVQPDVLEHSKHIFEAAEKGLPESTIFSLLQKWIQEDKASFIFRTLVNLDHSLADVAEALRRFVDLNPPHGLEVSEATARGIQVLLIRRLITNQLDYIRAAKRFLTVRDFYELIDHMVIPAKSHGVIGGKAAGLLLASRILADRTEERPRLANVTTPRTWYLPSDSLHYFMNYNDMEEMFEQKYKPIEEIRAEYPHIVQLFKSSRFPPEIVNGLSMALDDLGEVPIIVRSSSRLEDRFGSAFSGKYKSLFLTNQGTKQKRLKALLDAVAEVYSSLFGADPVQYRSERNLLDVREEMGVIIQQVVGNRVGPYFMPTAAGIAFSSNEFRWSPRIERGDGLLRIVPGLGTRAVDRLGDDYPVLAAPGKPEVRVNSMPDEVVRYAPHRADVINLAEDRFETIQVDALLREHGEELPGVERCVSIYSDGKLSRKARIALDFSKDDAVVTFEGLIGDSDFIGTVRDMLEVLESELQMAVDIEFAYDGERIWLLQCRPQSRSGAAESDPIPKDIPPQDVVFRATRHVSNGAIPDISHIVYVDPYRYKLLSSADEMRLVGRAVSELNRVLPRRSFVLIGPGRWGSRGDLQQGVSVTYADISNTAALIEVAVQGSEYMPDLSFGTHFFQDLVESNIKYLPIYPDDEGACFNHDFLRRSVNELPELLPECSRIGEVVRVIDVAKRTGGRTLRILLNAELDEGIGILSEPRGPGEPHAPQSPTTQDPRRDQGQHWQWRYEMAQRMVDSMDPSRFNVKAVYLLGSVKNWNSGPASDIDLIVHHQGSEEQLEQLKVWMEGWSLALDELNYLKTGYRSGGLLDVHYLTDEDIENRTSFAAKIGAATDAAEPLPLSK